MEDDIKYLEDNGVYIHMTHEHYKDTSNTMLSLEFVTKTENGYTTIQTASYGDNHEFGDTIRAIKCIIKLGKWYLEDEQRINLISSGYHDEKYIDYKNELFDLLNTLYTDKFKSIF
jgi:hypothetical protein